MYLSETESLIFEVRDQARNCFIIKAMCGLKHSKDQASINLAELPAVCGFGFF